MLKDGDCGLIVENAEEGIYNGRKKAITDQTFFQPYSSQLENAEMPFSLEKKIKKIMAVLDDL